MFDEKMRQVKDYSFNPLAKLFLAIPPWQFSMIGLLVGSSGCFVAADVSARIHPLVLEQGIRRSGWGGGSLK